MKVFEFTISIDQYVQDLDVVDAFYGRASDATLSGSEGKTVVHFDREASSLDDALRSALADIQAQGWQVLDITVDPACLLPLSTT
ncbi:MAG: hypothetical protein ACQESR_07765 [Planctomycetota bacterium]